MKSLFLWMVVAGVQFPAFAADLYERTFAWDNRSDWPAGTTVELVVNGVDATGLDGKTMPSAQHALSFPLAPGGRMDAKARAVTPAGYRCGSPPGACPYSEWATLAATLPVDQTGLWATVKSAAAASAPAFVAHYPTAFDTAATPKTALSAVLLDAGDVVVLLVAGESDGGTLGATENGAGTLVAPPAVDVSNYAEVRAFAYSATAPETLTAAFANSGAALSFGGDAVRFAGSSGIGASAKANGSTGFPAVSLTTTRANSAIVVIAADYRAAGGAQAFSADGGAGTPVPLAAVPGDGKTYGAAVAYYPDAGAAGPKTVGMSAPAGQAWGIVAVEVLGQ